MNTIKLLCKKSDVYENGEEWETTPLDIAYEIDYCPSFICHDSVQHLLESIWTGALPMNISWWQIYAMFFFPPYIWFVEFNEETIKYKKNEELTDYVDGDIDSVDRARAVLQHTGADGVMIGRAALGAPWLPGVIASELDGTPGVAAPDTNSERLAVARRHVARLHAFYGAAQGLRIARKHVVWYLEQLAQPADAATLKAWRQSFNALDDASAQLDALAGLAERLAVRNAA